VIIEHNLDVIHLADWLIDLGPGGGPKGGEIVYAGTRAGIAAESRSPTGQALRAWRREAKA
jgi:excinuclease ABC subunit A